MVTSLCWMKKKWLRKLLLVIEIVKNIELCLKNENFPFAVASHPSDIIVRHGLHDREIKVFPWRLRPRIAAGQFSLMITICCTFVVPTNFFRTPPRVVDCTSWTAPVSDCFPALSALFWAANHDSSALFLGKCGVREISSRQLWGISSEISVIINPNLINLKELSKCQALNDIDIYEDKKLIFL